jgi:hypothetical protein
VSDEFDEIIRNQPEGGGRDRKLEHIWEAIEVLVPEFYPGNILIKGVMVVEVLDEDGDRALRFIAHPDATPWDMTGLLDSALHDARHMGQYLPIDDEDDD